MKDNETTDQTDNSVELAEYESATGPIEFGMTVDYMFRVVLQKSKPARIGLISSVLRIKRKDIKDVTIRNPIDPGEDVSDKEIRMDVRVLLNNNTTIDLEMQIKNEGDWPDRSVVYLCREFDSISVGEEYDNVKSVYQIGFLNFTPFKDHPEFVGRYQLRNEKDNHLYTGKLNLYVISLNQIEMATEEDKAYGIDKWALLFKAKTWEELKMIAQNDKSMTSAAESIFLSNKDYNIRKVILERQEHERYVENLKKKNAALTSENATLTSENATLTTENATLITENEALTQELERLRDLLRGNGITDSE